MNAFLCETNEIRGGYMGITYESAKMRVLDAMGYKVDPQKGGLW